MRKYFPNHNLKEKQKNTQNNKKDVKSIAREK